MISPPVPPGFTISLWQFVQKKSLFTLANARRRLHFSQAFSCHPRGAVLHYLQSIGGTCSFFMRYESILLYHAFCQIVKSSQDFFQFVRFSLLFSSHRCIINFAPAGVMELVDVVDSKSTAGDSVPVRVRSPAPCRSKLYIACSDFLCKNQSALTPLLLLSKSNPLRWASIWFLVQPFSPCFFLSSKIPLWDILIFIVCDPKLNAAEISFDMPVSWYIIYSRFLFVFKSPSFFRKGMRHRCSCLSLYYC